VFKNVFEKHITLYTVLYVSALRTRILQQCVHRFRLIFMENYQNVSKAEGLPYIRTNALTTVKLLVNDPKDFRFSYFGDE
jgi:hypothetical protein